MLPSAILCEVVKVKIKITMSDVIGIIPARYLSVRFPGKLLVSILGKSLIQRTYENALQCKA